MKVHSKYETSRLQFVSFVYTKEILVCLIGLFVCFEPIYFSVWKAICVCFLLKGVGGGGGGGMGLAAKDRGSFNTESSDIKIRRGD